MRVATYESNRNSLALACAAVASSLATIAMLVVVPAMLEESPQRVPGPRASSVQPPGRDTHADTADANPRVGREDNHHHEERS